MIIDPSKEAVTYDEIKPEETTWPEQSESDKRILKQVVQDVQKGEVAIQSRALQDKWDLADRLFMARVPQQYWEGTKVPRSSLGVNLVFEHVDSIHPNIMEAIFADNPPFMVKKKPNTKMDAARGAEAVLGWELERTNFEEEIDNGLFEAMILGNAVWKLGWANEINKFYGMGDQQQPIEEELVLGHPTFEHVELKHIIVDPSLRYPNIQKAEWVAHRLYLNAYQLDALRLMGYAIPSRDQLLKIFSPPEEEARQALLEGARAYDMWPEFEPQPRYESPSSDPLARRLEVLEYWTKDKQFVVLNRKLVLMGRNNPWGKLPFVSIYYKKVRGSFYALGIPDLIGNEQRLQQGVLNTFLDDLAVQLHGMYLARRSSNIATQSIRTRPGGIIRQDKEGEIELLQRQPINIGVFDVLAASDARAQRRTAANELVVQGSLEGGQSSITRTARGVNALTGATGVRLQQIMKVFERQVIVPTLQTFHYFNRLYLKPSQIERLLTDELGIAYGAYQQDEQGNYTVGEDGLPIWIPYDPIEIVNAQMDFSMLAATKIAQRQAMAQSLPNITAYLTSDPALQAMKEQRKKLNWDELNKMWMDVSAWPNKADLIVDMNEADLQQLASENPMVQAQQEFMHEKMMNEITLDQIREENYGRMARDITKSLMDYWTANEQSMSDHDREMQLTVVDAILKGMGGMMAPQGAQQNGQSKPFVPGGSGKKAKPANKK